MIWISLCYNVFPCCLRWTSAFVRKDGLPLGTFSKYTWHITNVMQVKRIFDTPEVKYFISTFYYYILYKVVIFAKVVFLNCHKRPT